MPTPTSIPRLIKMLNSRAASRLPHGGGRSLSDHLLGTMKVLLHWRQPEEIAAAGLLHSIYSTDSYKRVLVPLSERAEIAAEAGESAERLAYLFCAIKRERLFADLPLEAATETDAIAVECHQGPLYQEISRQELGALLVLYMANAAEQIHSQDHSPGRWLAAASRWGLASRGLVQVLPPVFDSCSVELPVVEEQAGWRHYLEGETSFAAAPGMAAAKFAKAIEHVPWVAEPRVFLACQCLLEEQWTEALAYAASALTIFDQWGTAWDKRLPFPEWKAAAVYIKDCAEWGFTDPTAAGELAGAIRAEWSGNWVQTFKSFSSALRTSSLPPRLAAYLEAFAIPERPPKHMFYPGLGRRALYDAAMFPLARALEAAYEDIRSEFQSLVSGKGFQDEAEPIRRTGSWNVFMLYELGKRNEENCALCPATASVVAKHASVHSSSAAVYFSVMAPHSRIAAHTGPTNMRVRCHLAIKVPPDCGMRVGQEVLTWEEGKALVFNDALSHEVWNDSDEDRVVLVADMWHPDLSDEEAAYLEGLQRYAFAHAKDMHSYWQKNEKARSKYSLTRG